MQIVMYLPNNESAIHPPITLDTYEMPKKIRSIVDAL